jgi:hypothetical protein
VDRRQRRDDCPAAPLCGRGGHRPQRSITVRSQSRAAESDRDPERKYLAQAEIPGGEMQDIRFPAPRAAWWVGFNQLQLLFSSTVSPRDIGEGDDSRQLALAFSRVDVTPPKH